MMALPCFCQSDYLWFFKNPEKVKKIGSVLISKLHVFFFLTVSFLLFIYINALESPIIMLKFPVIIIFHLCSSAFNAFTVTVQPWQPDTSEYISGQMKWFNSVRKVTRADELTCIISCSPEAQNVWSPDWQERAELSHAKPWDWA